jgi:hypothetical protein
MVHPNVEEQTRKNKPGRANREEQARKNKQAIDQILLRTIGHAQVSSVGAAGEARFRGGRWRAVCDGERTARLVDGHGREGARRLALWLFAG